MIKLYAHQEQIADFCARHPRVLNTSDPGTGKTIASLEAYKRSIKGRLLVVAPLSILTPSWGQDINNYLPGFTYAIAHGNEKKRKQAFNSGADIVLINWDGVKWLDKNHALLDGFSHLIGDEFTAVKNRTAQRSKAFRSVSTQFEYIWLLSGTPNSNTILDIWHPALILDGGERLGKNFFQFRGQACTPQQVGPEATMVKWQDKPGIEQDVAALLSDISIRFRFEDCLDIPEHTQHTLFVDMPNKIMAQYRELQETSLLFTENGMVDAIHAGARVKKLLQLLTGAVYNSEGEIVDVHTVRYDLVMDLAEEREQCVVAFNWRHEREALVRLAEKRNLSYRIIDGSVVNADRTEAVEAFQAGQIKVLFAHPQSASHGLTLTRGTSTIWCSPTYNAEHFQQFNRRIYRAGQTRKTETICIAARNTAEMDVYEKLTGKIARMDDLLDVFCRLTEAA